MKSILKRLIYAITIAPLFIICGILQIISVFIVTICIYPFYWIITGKTFEPDYLLEGRLMIDPVIWLTDKLIGDE
jgi:hypothetical protein